MNSFFGKVSAKFIKTTATCLVGALLFSACDIELEPPHTSEPRFHLYAYGERVGFGLGGDSHRFRLHGWSHTEPHFTWTEGVGASLLFLVPRTNREVTLEMRLVPFVRPELPVQPVHVSVNHRKIATWQVTEDKVYTAVIPADFIAAPAHSEPGRPNLRDAVILVFDFFIPKAHFPAILADAPDWRRLGVACVDLAMKEGAARPEQPNVRGKGDVQYTLRTPIRFGAHQNAERYIRTGWHQSEAGWTWTSNGRAVLQFKLPPVDGPLNLIVRAHGNTRPPDLLTQPTVVYANQQQIAEWDVDILTDYSAEIPAAALRPDGLLTLEFVSRNATSPRALGVNQDARPLGISCHSLIITEAEE